MSLSMFKIVVTLLTLCIAALISLVFDINFISTISIVAFLLSVTNWAETLFIKLIVVAYDNDIKKVVNEILGGDDGSSGKSE